jgi:HPt (histidine-containing phosphotransfer) domain-containing protein
MQTPPKKQEPEASAGSHAEMLEQAMLERIRQLGLETDPVFVLDLIDSYAPLFEKLHANLLEAFSKKDRDKLHYAAHSIKGASLNVGAADLAGFSRTIEEESQRADLSSMAPMLQKLSAEVQQTKEALNSIRSKLSQQKSP